MALDEVSGQDWTRKHDEPGVPVVPNAPRTVYPKSLEELIEICSKRLPFERLHAAGSHWALSDAALRDHTFVETHDPDNQHQAMGRTLYEVVGRNGCLDPTFVEELAGEIIPPFDAETVAENAGLYPIHIETGKRVYQLYAELDYGDADNEDSLANVLKDMGNSSYLGPWAFRTLGGAGGQTVFGALTTGTHGGDFRTPPIADSVMALHLVVDGGKHYWIEPETLTPFRTLLTDKTRLEAVYGQKKYGGPDNFEVIRDNDLFNAVLISAGRFGIVYSIVIAAVRQYCLHQERRLTFWQGIEGLVNDTHSTLFTKSDDEGRNRFLQIVVCPTPFMSFNLNLAGVTKRWNVGLAARPGTDVPAGRTERRGAIVDPFDPSIQAPRFAAAGNSFVYTPDSDRPGLASDPSFLEQACTNADFVAGIIRAVIQEVEEFITSKGTVVGATIAAVAIFAAIGTVLLWAAPLLILLAVLAAVALYLEAQAGKESAPRLGQVMNDIKNSLLSDPEHREAGLFLWQMLCYKVFSSAQGDSGFSAISYAVMDGHNYLDESCEVNVDSIEVFFDATNPMLSAYVDALLAYEHAQEILYGKAFVGYISLRFCGETRALIGEEQFPMTCVVEVSGLRDVTGVTELIDYAIQLALNSNFKGILHWGQRNESTRADVEERFGDTQAVQSGKLFRWRAALSSITEHGKLHAFSSAFTRQTGLEIVTPVIGDLSVEGTTKGQPITIKWDCDQNPPNTKIHLQVISPAGARTSFSALPRKAQRQILAAETGLYSVELTATIDLGGERRGTKQHEEVMVT